jgi:DNA repair protein RadC
MAYAQVGALGVNMEDIFNPYDIPEIQISYTSNVPASKRPRIKSSKDAYIIALSHWDRNRIELIEQVKAILLNKNMRVMGIAEISTGGISESTVDKRILFGIAIKAAASNIILVHNHPSGDVEPSNADKQTTQILSQLGRFLGIKICDHLVITPHAYYSFADERIMP